MYITTTVVSFIYCFVTMLHPSEPKIPHDSIRKRRTGIRCHNCRIDRTAWMNQQKDGGWGGVFGGGHKKNPKAVGGWVNDLNQV